MARGPENKFKDELKRKLNNFPNQFHFTKEALALRGIPDIVGCINGKFFVLEVKASKYAKRTALQTYILSKVDRSGGFGAFIYPENSEDILQKLYAHCCLN